MVSQSAYFGLQILGPLNGGEEKGKTVKIKDEKRGRRKTH